KVGVVDRDWATVGSSNIDPFSLLLAREANVVVRDPDFSSQLHHSLGMAISDGGQELLPGHWRRIPWYSRWLRRLAYSLVRVMIGIAGYGAKH
ncbi:MAG TPA: phospholipase D-like domain-containing protein, partial [Azospira sp.]|nr:phospholipase D-like domain-containing protein [Azospira sp.]